MGVRATDIRKGHVLEMNGDLLLITDYEHKTPGNLRAIINIKTRSLSTGQAGSMRLGSGDMLDVAFLERKKCEYLYRESNGDFVFMDTESYEQFPLGDDLVGEKMGFVRENSQVEVTFHGERAIGVDLPPQVVLTGAAAAAAVKGNTAQGVKKEAVLETGLAIKVPMHIVVGEEVRVNTDNGEFMGRAN